MCANPTITKFDWFFSNETLIKSTKENKLSLKIEEYMKSEAFGPIEIYCIADNGIESTDGKSRTNFIITYEAIKPKGKIAKILYSKLKIV